MDPPIIIDPTTWLERRLDQDASRSEIAALRETLDSTRLTRQHDVKHRADHGRALIHLSQALLYMEGAHEEDKLEAYNEALQHMEEAREIWLELGRERALHLAEIRIVELRSLLATLPAQRGAVMQRLRHLEEAQRREPDKLARPYRATLLATRARCHARQGETAQATHAVREAIQTLEALIKKNSETNPELVYLRALHQSLEDLHKCANSP